MYDRQLFGVPVHEIVRIPCGIHLVSAIIVVAIVVVVVVVIEVGKVVVAGVVPAS